MASDDGQLWVDAPSTPAPDVEDQGDAYKQLGAVPALQTTHNGGDISQPLRDMTIHDDRNDLSISHHANRMAASTRENGGIEHNDDEFDDDDFGDFGEAQAAPVSETPSITTIIQHRSPGWLRLLDMDDFSSTDMLEAATAVIADDIFPTSRMIAATSEPYDPPAILKSPLQVSNRSASLWSNLREVPSPQLTDWRTSRIRRTYLVSLGVPVDLDQVLPAKKRQEKLVLSSRRSMQTSNGPLSARQSMQSTRSAPLPDDVGSDPPTRPASVPPPATSSLSRSGTPGPPPDFDADYARQISRVSDLALKNMTAEELSAHVQELERVKIEASTVLAYWVDKRNSSAEDKTKYEGVIESSIEYAQRLRRHTTRVAAIPRPLSRNKSVTR
ncbi:hypothetical protein V1520DRAFT_345079 [Lipomyces starkeyi]|uniref:Uncharacterized protein n=1 Tax=Lipomyces starkeyi NRRL Y-11557 TaxID=675824 RepID=A0A1E3QI13_LIPST|nr:hypothetical protein LIPSTDRAFT_637 [Lipomyces starkeyi NRRL Y-11557]